MACVSSAFFAVLINDSPSAFFNVSWGLHQGCPLSPFLFLLVIEGFSLLINVAKNRGQIVGIKFSSSLSTGHLFFVDDVVLFGYSGAHE